MPYETHMHETWNRCNYAVEETHNRPQKACVSNDSKGVKTNLQKTAENTLTKTDQDIFLQVFNNIKKEKYMTLI